MRLIDADALKNWIDCGHLRSPTELCFSEQDVVQILDMRPTIDPAKHGHWYWLQYDANPRIGNWHCSKCNLLSLNKSLYCPRCGARIDGEAE